MIARIPVFVFLVATWFALWGSASVATAVTGSAVAAVAIALSPKKERRQNAFRVVAVARFLGAFAVRLVVANAVLAWEVVTPRNRINEGVVAVPIEDVSDLVTTIISNAITLTPGSLTLDVRRDPDPVLYVHVLHIDDVEDVRRDVMRLEEMAIAAFGPRREDAR